MWELDFIKREDFKEHVKNTIKTYGETLKSIDLSKFNKNIIDPIKLTFDNKVYKQNLVETINNEIVRQRDKTNNNAIGYFHQNMFRYIKNCLVPTNGFDVIFSSQNKKIYVEMKNKHNTMNSSASQKTYMRMLNQILKEDNCYCYLVEIIAKHSQNIVWGVSVDNEPVSNDRIRRVSIDKFYEEVTGDSKAFYKICKVLPDMIDEIIKENKSFSAEDDTVILELLEMDDDILRSLFMLAFKEYLGFSDL